jgi:hypothetical protein
METMMRAGLAGALLVLMAGAASAQDFDWDDIFAPYRQRIDTETTSSGNAQNVNAATQMLTPWPPYVQNRHLLTDGARMVGAVERYRNPLGASGSAAPPQKPSAQVPVPEAGGGPGASQGDAAQSGKQEQGAQSGQ